MGKKYFVIYRFSFIDRVAPPGLYIMAKTLGQAMAIFNVIDLLYPNLEMCGPNETVAASIMPFAYVKDGEIVYQDPEDVLDIDPEEEMYVNFRFMDNGKVV